MILFVIRRWEIIFLVFLFIFLNFIDVVLTNKLVDEGSTEANVLLKPFAGSWLLLLKILFAFAVIFIVRIFKRFSIRNVLFVLCIIMAGVCGWNGYIMLAV